MKDINSIKGLINKEVFQEVIDENNDPYGSACVNVAINIMEYLDTFTDQFNIGYHPDLTTPHGIICECDDQGGISGFMAAASRNMVAKYHEIGWKFYIADMINPCNINDIEDVENSINAVVEANLVSRNEAVAYTNDLIERYKSIKQKQKGA